MHEFDEHQQSTCRGPDCNHGDRRLQGPEMVRRFNIVFKEEPEDDHEPWGQSNAGMSSASSHGSEETTSTSGKPEQHRENHQTATSSHRCCDCGQEFPGAFDLMLHQRTHYIRNRVPCGTHTMTAHQQTYAVKREPGHTDEEEVEEVGGLIKCEEAATWDPPQLGMSPASSHGSEETTSTSGEPEQRQENLDTATMSHRCFGCGQEFPAAYELMLHQRTRIERGFYKSVCGELFYQEELLKVPRQKVDTGIPVQHQKNPKAKKSHDCVVCGKQLSETMKLKRHMRTHTGEKPYGCSVCGRGFTQKGNLKTHMKTHRGLNPKLWSAGEDSPSTSGEPEQHRKNHTAKTFHNCIECGEICQTLPALKKHMKTHTRKKPSYQCSLCGAEFTEKGQIQDHQLQHVGEKPYSCPDCGKCFVNESYIKIHQRTHTGERPYTCLVCGKSFVKKAYLKSHLLTHTGEKPYLCSTCGKTYSREGTFKIHQRVHTGEKPYLCTECGKRFSCRANLYSHKKRHAGKPIGPKRQLGRPKQLPN
uniref:C2H2-type domain-containing protein n=1 Tax=Hucho hucho TaxID=62062 RepID=A0A4W5KXA6_9TELE